MYLYVVVEAAFESLLTPSTENEAYKYRFLQVEGMHIASNVAHSSEPQSALHFSNCDNCPTVKDLSTVLTVLDRSQKLQ